MGHLGLTATKTELIPVYISKEVSRIPATSDDLPGLDFVYLPTVYTCNVVPSA